MNLTSSLNRMASRTRPHARRRWVGALALLALGATFAFAAARELGFSRSVTKGLVENYSSKFGWGSARRLTGWPTFVSRIPTELARQSGSEQQMLAAVNTFFNRLPFVSDQEHWGVEDYWASPAEMLASDGGDCEDYAIAKYFTLKELGVPIERLRITYVKAVRLNQAHMVLAYYATPDAVPLILDNLEERVRPATERTDLVPVYNFNDDDVMLVPPNQPAASAGSPLQLRLWSGLLDKLEKELQY